MNINFNAIPEEMKKLPNWVCWRWQQRNGKKTKMPYNPTTGNYAKSNDPATWADFQTVKGQTAYDGIGFMLSSSPFVGIDIDHCIIDGKISRRPQEIVDSFSSYTEISPSGTGVHIIIKADINGPGKRNSELEIYSQGRYLTVTGDVLQGRGEIAERTQEVKELLYSLGNKRDVPPPVDITAQIERAGNASLDTLRILDLIKRSRQGILFTKLFDMGDISGYKSASEADMALMDILPFWTQGNRVLMLQIFNMSALGQREKWKTRPDYQKSTIEQALKSWNGVSYDPQAMKEKQLKQDRFIQENKILKSRDELKKLIYFELNDTGNAERLELVYGDIIRYCIDSDTWYKWDGKRWKQLGVKATELYNLVSAVMRLADMEYTRINGQPQNKDDEAAEKQFKRFCKKSENMRSITSTVRRAEALLPIELEKLDADPWLLNCQNGVIDLKTGDLLPHDRMKYMTQICHADYVPGGWQSDLWENTISQIIPDTNVLHYLHKFIGYCLTGLTREEKLLFLYGAGGGGKGTFIETIARVLGDYADTVPVDILLSARNDAGSGNEPTPQLAKMTGKRLIVTSESGQGRRFNDARVKLLTGGDKITARLLRQNPFTFTPMFKIVMSSNFQPAVTNIMDQGMKRRLVIVPFDSDLKNIRDVTIKERLLLPQERAGILSWCVDGCLLWQKEGLDDMPDAIKKSLIDYYNSSDLIGEFIETYCDVAPDKHVYARDLLQAFNEKMNDGRGWHDMRLSTFSENMKMRDFHKRHYKNGTHFEGIDLKADWRMIF